MSQSPIKVQLIAGPDRKKKSLVQFSAGTCYNPDFPVFGESNINIDERLIDTGHHTTLEHSGVTFAIDGIAISDVTLGLHLVNVFYNSDQRSGRYCKKMFENPDIPEIMQYINSFYNISAEAQQKIMSYLKESIDLYFKNINLATLSVEKNLKQERPNLSEKSLKTTAPKIAQEQLRMFFPTIFPTALVFTVDDIALASLCATAWNPAMREVAGKMVSLYLEKYPDMQGLFNQDIEKEDWSPKLLNQNSSLIEKPVVSNFEIRGEKHFVPLRKFSDAFPLDKLQFSPYYMNNKKGRIDYDLEISVATMGQDQRHRTIDRGSPVFTGNFYLTPILKELSLEKDCLTVLNNWKSLHGIIPDALFTSLVPYGAMVSYHKSANFNAVIHEQGKRLCWCAQEEIYHIGRSLRNLTMEKLGKDHKLVSIFQSPCYSGPCIEGTRYCGRDLKVKEFGDYFPERKV
ncbi:MAG: FAD-dependent thymidylate synthase [Patescibacteria group bacterium]|nr:FAD-dependent thymidylate synthase [Patescibacteria group bacterium]